MAMFPDFFRWRHGELGPFRELARMQRELDRGLFPALTATDTGMLLPACEVTETERTYEVKAELPGIPKDAIKVEIEADRISISAEKKEEKRDEKKHLSEFSYGSYYRSFALPGTIDTERSSAAYDNGVLRISAQKAAPGPKARQISVK